MDEKSSSSLILNWILNFFLEPSNMTCGWNFNPCLRKFGSIHIARLGCIQVGEKKVGCYEVEKEKENKTLKKGKKRKKKKH